MKIINNKLGVTGRVYPEIEIGADTDGISSFGFSAEQGKAFRAYCCLLLRRAKILVWGLEGTWLIIK
jgi:hypothetical protein